MYNKFLEYLLSNDPNEVISKAGIIFRKVLNPVFRRLIVLTCKAKLVKEGMPNLPKDRPIIFAGTHGFRDDIAFSLNSIDRNAYVLYASIPDFFESIDGIGLWINGVVLLDRKKKDSRTASKEKMVKAIEEGADLLVFPEGVWNKTPNLVVQKLFPGIHDVASRTNAIIVPIATILEGDKGYSKIGEPFNITQYDRKEGLLVLRDILATLKWDLMEKYSRAKREDFDGEYWTRFLEDLIATANGLYDEEIENVAHYQDKNEISAQEVFAPLDNVTITKENAYVLAKTLNRR